MTICIVDHPPFRGRPLSIYCQGGGAAQVSHGEAPSAVTEKRISYFKTLGENCPIGCAGEFRMLRQSGTDLLAVVDVTRHPKISLPAQGIGEFVVSCEMALQIPGFARERSLPAAQ